MVERPTIAVATAPGGWPTPWPNVAEIAEALPHNKWTLVGGLMVQLHAFNAGITTTRPTTDVDMMLHIETMPGVVAEAARQLESLGYELVPPTNQRKPVVHRFTRGTAVVDILIADHAPPRVQQRLRGAELVAAAGGTQALRRTVNAQLEIVPGMTTTISVPSAFGALIGKAAAAKEYSRDPSRHLLDAAVLLSVLKDPIALRETFEGSDRSRLLFLRERLPDEAREWRSVDEPWRTDGQTALRILTR